LEWYINGNGQTVGLDLGAAPGNVELVTIGHFDSNSAKSEMIVRNQSDGHLYEWWVTPNGTLSGVDLTANSGVGTGVQIIGTGNYFGSGDDDLLVHDTSKRELRFVGATCGPARESSLHYDYWNCLDGSPVLA